MALEKVKGQTNFTQQNEPTILFRVKTQDNFKIPGIKTKEMLNLFKWRVRMAPLGENFRGNKEHILCPFCQNHLDNQPTFLQCEVMRKEMPEKIKIEEIYSQNIKLETEKPLNKVEELRQTMIKQIE